MAVVRIPSLALPVCRCEVCGDQHWAPTGHGAHRTVGARRTWLLPRYSHIAHPLCTRTRTISINERHRMRLHEGRAIVGSGVWWTRYGAYPCNLGLIGMITCARHEDAPARRVALAGSAFHD